MADSDVWQYGHKAIERDEIIETKAWPHPSFQPLNYSAARVLEFFTRGRRAGCRGDRGSRIKFGWTTG